MVTASTGRALSRSGRWVVALTPVMSKRSMVTIRPEPLAKIVGWGQPQHAKPLVRPGGDGGGLFEIPSIDRW